MTPEQAAAALHRALLEDGRFPRTTIGRLAQSHKVVVRDRPAGKKGTPREVMIIFRSVCPHYTLYATETGTIVTYAVEKKESRAGEGYHEVASPEYTDEEDGDVEDHD